MKTLARRAPKAGAAKSTTLLATLSLITWTPNFDRQALQRSLRPLILTFNKHNQKQLAECAPRHASEVLTFHAIGNRFWSARPMNHELFVNAREFDVKDDKVKRLVNSVIGEAVERKEASRADEKLASFVRELVKLAQSVTLLALPQTRHHRIGKICMRNSRELLKRVCNSPAAMIKRRRWPKALIMPADACISLSRPASRKSIPSGSRLLISATRCTCPSGLTSGTRASWNSSHAGGYLSMRRRT